MGSGDWNDGMNQVGDTARRERLAGLLPLRRARAVRRRRAAARRRAFAERCQEEAAQLRQNLEQHGWDGEWYRRAYFDDGTPLGSASNAECQIDSIAQSWSVLSGRRAMPSARAWPWRRWISTWCAATGADPALDPPFDKSATESRLHQGLRPGRARERRAVHPCGHLGGDGVRRLGRSRRAGSSWP